MLLGLRGMLRLHGCLVLLLYWMVRWLHSCLLVRNIRGTMFWLRRVREWGLRMPWPNPWLVGIPRLLL
mgnify:CR=1 FL=1